MGDVAVYAPETRRLLRSARNDKFLAHVILRHGVLKNLVRGQKTNQFFPPIVPLTTIESTQHFEGTSLTNNLFIIDSALGRKS